jgi:dihydrodipicolinate synthase/N-acetylneuraminate lyase
MTDFPRHRGVIVPLVTPVTPTGSLDEAAATRLVEHLASNHCGMLVLGTTGEVASLPAALRQRYVELAVRVADGRTPVFACIAQNCLANSVDAAREYLRAGADAVVAMLPNFFKLEPADMEAYFERLVAGIAGPVLLYNMPATTGMSVPIDVIERLSHIPNVTGLKDSENTPGRQQLVAERLGGRADFSLFMGVAAQSVTALKLGFVGLVPSSGNLYPQLWHELYTVAQAGKWTRAEELQRRLDAIGTVFQRNRSLGQSLAALKAGLAAHQLCEPYMMPPLRHLDPVEQTVVRSELAALT